MSVNVTPSPLAQHQDWGNAPGTDEFYGRQVALAQLERWILDDRCRLVAILGLGGMGKTALATRLARQIQPQFDSVIWRSLRNGPTLDEMLETWLVFFSEHHQGAFPARTSQRLALLLDHLQQRRCLLLLDNVETILQAGVQSGRYRQGYEGYGQLVQQLGSTNHQSCLLLTSREKPEGFQLLEGETGPVRSLDLTGLDQADVRAILKHKGLFAPDQAWADLTQAYSGNPLALKLIADNIQELYGGDIVAFLDDGETVFGDIYTLLEQQFGRLSDLEKEIMYWLAVERQPVSLPALDADLANPVPRRELMAALTSLRRRSLVERVSTGAVFTQQPMVMEYVTERFVDGVYQEMTSEVAATAVETPEADARKGAILANLTRQIANHYGEEALRTLCLEVGGIDYDDLPARGKSNKARELVLELDRLGRLAALVRLLQQQRPQIPWAEIAEIDPDVSPEPLLAWRLKLMLDHALMKAQSQDHVRDSQIRFIVRPLLERLQRARGGREEVRKHLLQLLAFLRRKPRGEQGYGGGNVINLLHHLPANLRGYDFSGLMVRQTYLKGVELPDVNFAHSDLATAVFTDVFGSVLSLKFSPDGIRLAGGCDDHTVRLWDASTGRSLMVLEGHIAPIWSVAFSPDGTRLASGGEDEDWDVRLWDVTDGQRLMNLSGHTNRIRHLTFSPDGAFLVSSSDDGTVRLWDVESGRCLATLADFDGWVWASVISPDGHRLISVTEAGTVTVWDVSSRTRRQTLAGHDGRIWTAAVHPDGEIYATGGEDTGIKLWRLGDDQCLRTLSGHTGPVRSLAFSPDGETLASGSSDQTIKLWRIPAGEILASLPGHTSGLTAVTFSPDGQLLASSNEERIVRVWQVERKRYLRTFQGHVNRVVSLAFDADGARLAHGDEDRSVRIWDLASGQCQQTLQGHTRRVRSLAFSRDGATLVTGSESGRMKWWQADDGRCLRTWTAHDGWVWGIAFSPDGSWVASGSEDGSVKLWDTHNWDCLQTMVGHRGQVWSLAASPNGAIVASRGEDRTVRLWDAASGDCLYVLQDHTSWVSTMAFAPDGDTLATFSVDGTIKLWQLSDGQCIDTIPHQASQARRIAFHPHLATFAAAHDDQTIAIWKVQDEQKTATLRGHTDLVRVLTFSPDGNTVAAGIDDGTIWLWDAGTGEELKTLRSERPYERMNITGASGLTEAQKSNLHALGAVEDPEDLS